MVFVGSYAGTRCRRHPGI